MDIAAAVAHAVAAAAASTVVVVASTAVAVAAAATVEAAAAMVVADTGKPGSLFNKRPVCFGRRAFCLPANLLRLARGPLFRWRSATPLTC
jgi:hypothetical protein